MLGAHYYGPEVNGIEILVLLVLEGLRNFSVPITAEKFCVLLFLEANVIDFMGYARAINEKYYLYEKIYREDAKSFPTKFFRRTMLIV